MSAALVAAQVFSEYGQYGAAGFVVLIAWRALRWTERHQREWVQTARTRIDDLEEDNKKIHLLHAKCEWRTEILFGALRSAGVPIPESYWALDLELPESPHLRPSQDQAPEELRDDLG